jgi:chromosome segregation ATPase
MPRAPTITQADVNAICDRLLAEGVRPGVRRIIEEHGSGAQGTVYPLFKNWEAGKEHPTQVAATLSPVLQRALLDFVNRETSSAKAALEAQLAESEQVAADLARENERQANELDEQAEAHGKLLDALASLQGRVDQLDKDLLAAHEETARERSEAEKARTDLAVALLRLEAMPRLEADLEAARAACDIERRARIAAEQAAAVATAQKDGLAERLTENKARIEALEAQLIKEQESARRQAAELTAARVAVEAANARLESADREIKSARESASEARSREREAIETAAELRGQIKPAAK